MDSEVIEDIGVPPSLQSQLSANYSEVIEDTCVSPSLQLQLLANYNLLKMDSEIIEDIGVPPSLQSQLSANYSEVIEDTCVSPSLQLQLLANYKLLEAEREDDLVNKYAMRHPFELQNWPIFNLLSSDFIKQIDMVMVIGSDGTEAIIVTRDKMVYVLGNKNTTKLELKKYNSLEPIQIEFLCGKSIKKCVSCMGFQATLLHEGLVY